MLIHRSLLQFAAASFLFCLSFQDLRGGDNKSFKVLSWNIHHAEGLDGKVDVKRIADVIIKSEADLVALQEVDRRVERSGRLDLPRLLAERTGMHFCFGKNIDYQGGDYGNAILSKRPIEKWNNHHFKMLRSNEQRGLLTAEIRIGSTALLFMSAHLDYRPDPAERISNIQEIVRFIQDRPDTPRILCGDFNEPPGQKIHPMITGHFGDAWLDRRTKPDIGGEEGFTFSSANRSKRIDYVFYRPQNVLTPIAAKVLESNASDHLPLLVEFEFELD